MQILFINRAVQTFHHFPEHEHPYWEILLTTAGTGYQMVGGKKYPFSPGKIICIPPHTIHSSHSDGGFSDACIMYDDFPPLNCNKVVEFQDDQDRHFTYLFDFALETIQKNSPNAIPLANAIGDSIYELLVSWHDVQNGNDSLIDDFKKTLIQNVGNSDFDLSDAIDRTGFCKGYFRRIFKENTGEAPVQYFNHLRIEYAKRQFHQYSKVLTVKQIAACAGFKDPYHFSKVFKKYTGTSPSEYINDIENTPQQNIAAIEKYDYR